MGSARRDAAMSAGSALAGSADGCWGSDRKDGRREGRDWRVESVLTEEGLEIVDNLLLGDGEVVVEEEEELLLHKVYLLLGEHLRVAAPMLVLWGRVVEVLGGDNESGQENTVTSAGEAFGHLGQAVP